MLETNENIIIRAIQASLTPELLKRPFRHVPGNPLAGHCYVATEALYHLLGGPASGYFPVRARDAEGVVHWWLENASGRILDPTANQYYQVAKVPPYKEGRRGGFLTKTPSKRTMIIIDRSTNCLLLTVQHPRV